MVIIQTKSSIKGWLIIKMDEVCTVYEFVPLFHFSFYFLLLLKVLFFKSAEFSVVFNIGFPSSRLRQTKRMSKTLNGNAFEWHQSSLDYLQGVESCFRPVKIVIRVRGYYSTRAKWQMDGVLHTGAPGVRLINVLSIRMEDYTQDAAHRPLSDTHGQHVTGKVGWTTSGSTWKVVHTHREPAEAQQLWNRQKNPAATAESIGQEPQPDTFKVCWSNQLKNYYFLPKKYKIRIHLLK